MEPFKNTFMQDSFARVAKWYKYWAFLMNDNAKKKMIVIKIYITFILQYNTITDWQFRHHFETSQLLSGGAPTF